MSLTYTTLQARMASYLKRGDLTASLPFMVTMCENEINRRLKLVNMESIESFTYSAAASTVAMSTIHADCISVLKIWKIVNGVFEEIVYLEPLQFLKQRIISTSTGQPNYYTIQGGETVYFDRTADQNYTLYAQIRQKYDLAADSTNWLASRHEEAYLFGSLAQAEPFIKNDKRIITWRTMFEAVLSQLEEQDTETRSQRNMILIPDITHVLPPGLYNINTG